MTKFKYIILKTPSKLIQSDVITDAISIVELFKQHETLVNFFKNLELKVHGILPSKDPVYLSVNDLCILTRKCVIFTNYENKVLNNHRLEMAATLSRFYPLDRMCYINFPATLSAKDVLEINDTFYVSISNETNMEGAEKFKEHAEKWGFKVIIITNSEGSLRKNLNYLEHNNMLIKEGYALPEEFKEFNLITVPLHEESAIGSIWANDTIIMPKDCETVWSQLVNLNKYVVVKMNDSEFRKLNIKLNELVALF